MKKLKLLVLLALAAVTQTSFGALNRPHTVLGQLKPLIEEEAMQQAGDLIPISMHAHYLTAFHFNVGLRKYGDDFADFNGQVGGQVLQANRYYHFTCSVSSRAWIAGFAMQPPENIILQDQGANEKQLLGRVKVKCRLQ